MTKTKNTTSSKKTNNELPSLTSWVEVVPGCVPPVDCLLLLLQDSAEDENYTTGAYLSTHDVYIDISGRLLELRGKVTHYATVTDVNGEPIWII